MLHSLRIAIHMCVPVTNAYSTVSVFSNNYANTFLKCTLFYAAMTDLPYLTLPNDTMSLKALNRVR